MTRRRRSVSALLVALLAASLTFVAGGGASADTAWFGSPVNRPVGTTPWSGVSGDVDRDGRPDLVVSHYRPAGVTVMRNTASGWQQFSFPSTGQIDIELADVTGDGWLDVVTTGTDGVWVHRNQNGFFNELPMIHPLPSAFWTEIGEVNGDGRPDAIVHTSVGGGEESIHILRGDGAGRFTEIDHWASPETRELVLADLDGDDRDDVAVPHIAPAGVEVRLNRGDGTFGPGATYSAGGNLPQAIAAADFNRDGRTDLAVVHHDEFAVLTNTGDGAFGSPKLFPTAPENIGTGAVTAGDVNADGRVDLTFAVYGANSVSVVENLGGGRFAAPVLFPVHLSPQTVSIDDFDRDGRADLAVVNNDSNDVSFLYRADEPPPADLELGVAVTPEVSAGGEVRLNARLNNRGPVAANAVEYRVDLPANARLVAPETPYHGCRQSSAVVTCELGLVPAGAELYIGLRILLPKQASSASFAATVRSATEDPDPSDDGSGAAARVAAPPSGVVIENADSTQQTGTPRVVSIAATGVVEGTPLTLTVDSGHPGSALPTGSVVGIAASPTGRGYWLAGADGSVSAQGDAAHHGDDVRSSRAGAVVEIAATPTGLGYWLADADGRVAAFGDARLFGSLSGRVAEGRPITGFAATPTGLGYWLAGADGSVAAFGDAGQFGSREGRSVPMPIMGLRRSASGRGYWLFGADGAVHAYGDATDHGSLDHMPLHSPFVDLVPTPGGGGYWLVQAGGAIYAEGDAAHFGNPAGRWPATGYLRAMAVRPDGGGYWLAADDGAVFAYGGAEFFGPRTTVPTFDGRAELTYTSVRPGVTVATAGVRTTGGGLLSSGASHDTWVGLPAPPPPPPPPPPGPGDDDPAVNSANTGSGYWMLGGDGTVYAFGHGGHAGDAAPVGGVRSIDLEPTPSGAGYLVVDERGRVQARGDAVHRGDIDVNRLGPKERPTSLSITPSGHGYWVFTTAGRAFSFGDAPSLGDLTGLTLNGAVLDSIPTPSGRGYYMVASDGGIFAFGDARFHGSMGGRRLNAPVQSLVPDGDGHGYWLVASDGGIFAFDAAFRGSMGHLRLNRPVTGMVRYGNGYLMVGEDGGLFNFSDKPFAGSLGDRPPAAGIVSVAAMP